MCYLSCVCLVFYIVWCYMLVFFFFKQKTAYEMRISDWSSDVVLFRSQVRHLRQHRAHREDSARANPGRVTLVPADAQRQIIHSPIVGHHSPPADRKSVV